MIEARPLGLTIAMLVMSACLSPLARATEQTEQGTAPPAPQVRAIFAVEFRTGPGWDPAKPPGEQANFSEHSANLKQLREDGTILLGARYSDKGLIVITGDSEVEVRAMIDADPAVRSGTFVYELHPMNVFYPGCVDPRKE